MLDLQLPARHDWAVHEKSYGKLVMEPFEPGFALTVGIAYRRALLSAIHGAAPTWGKIEHVLHEFSHLPGVTEDTLDIMIDHLPEVHHDVERVLRGPGQVRKLVEDMLDIMMNLRKVVFVLHVNRPK